MIEFACGGCGQRLAIGDEFAGQHVACGQCHALLEVPAPPPKPVKVSVANPSPEGQAPLMPPARRQAPTQIPARQEVPVTQQVPAAKHVAEKPAPAAKQSPSPVSSRPVASASSAPTVPTPVTTSALQPVPEGLELLPLESTAAPEPKLIPLDPEPVPLEPKLIPLPPLPPTQTIAARSAATAATTRTAPRAFSIEGVYGFDGEPVIRGAFDAVTRGGRPAATSVGSQSKQSRPARGNMPPLWVLGIGMTVLAILPLVVLSYLPGAVLMGLGIVTLFAAYVTANVQAIRQRPEAWFYIVFYQTFLLMLRKESVIMALCGVVIYAGGLHRYSGEQAAEFARKSKAFQDWADQQRKNPNAWRTPYPGFTPPPGATPGPTPPPGYYPPGFIPPPTPPGFSPPNPPGFDPYLMEAPKKGATPGTSPADPAKPARPEPPK